MKEKQPPETAQPDKGAFVLRYRALRSSLFFAILWIIIALGAVWSVGRFQVPIKSPEGITLIMTSVLCLALALTSLEQYGSPFIYLYPDRLKIHYSLLRNINLKYSEIAKIKVVEEDLELIPQTGLPVILNLGHLSFRNQAALIKKLNETLSSNRDKK